LSYSVGNADDYVGATVTTMVRTADGQATGPVSYPGQSIGLPVMVSAESGGVRDAMLATLPGTAPIKISAFCESSTIGINTPIGCHVLVSDGSTPSPYAYNNFPFYLSANGGTLLSSAVPPVALVGTLHQTGSILDPVPNSGHFPFYFKAGVAGNYVISIQSTGGGTPVTIPITVQ
jgi:hypothetical protein